MRRQIPLLFTFRDRVVGMGFTAQVESYGRVLASEEDGEVWIFGVEPGALAASGADPKEALEAFRQTFANVLRDFASEARDFQELEQAVQAFFADVNEANAGDWLRAVDAVRSGAVELANVRREPAESRRFVQVREETPAVDERASYEIVGSTIESTVAA